MPKANLAVIRHGKERHRKCIKKLALLEILRCLLKEEAERAATLCWVLLMDGSNGDLEVHRFFHKVVDGLVIRVEEGFVVEVEQKHSAIWH
eukprot:755522-Rhodomonas_salina.1